MDSIRVDRLSRALAAHGPRRGVLGLLTAVPVVGGLLALLTPEETEARGRRKRRKTRNARRSGNDKDNRKDKRNRQTKRSCAKAGQTPRKGNRKGCCKGLIQDASGRCAASVAPGPTPAVCTGLKPTSTSPTQGLQEAIDQAATDGITTLTLCAGTWTLTSTVVIRKDLTLIGAGAGATILEGGGTVRVLLIDARVTNVTVTLQDLTITKGGIDGGGAGIFNSGTLTLRRVSVTGNTATGLAGHGGGIDNDGALTLEAGSSVTGNTATSLAGGGGIYTLNGTVTLQPGSRVTGNTAPDGAGIYNANGTVTLDSGAIICGNLPLDKQCSGGYAGTCPAPSPTCP